MFKTLFSILPCLVCFFWSIIYFLRWNKHNRSQHILTLFAVVCTVLYGCHARFFSGESSLLTDVLWSGCSLSVYPLYYYYLVSLSSETRCPWARLSVLLVPALVIPVLKLLFGWSVLERVQQLAFVVVTVYVCVRGLQRLSVFDRRLKEYYADTEDKSSYQLRLLLIFFTITSFFSAIFSVIGRNVFAEDLLVMIPSILFSTMLFAVLYMGDSYAFEAIQMQSEGEQLPKEEVMAVSESTQEEQARYIARLRYLMEEEKIYLEPNLKISDVAVRAGTCRTYISNYINQQMGMSFSDYINKQRIAHAEALLESEPDAKISYLSMASGFVSEQSFLRNYRKFTGHAIRESK